MLAMLPHVGTALVVTACAAPRVPSVPALVISACALPRTPSVLVTDGMAPSALKALADGGANVVESHLSPEELAAGGLAAHDAVLIRSATTLTAQAIASGAAGSLRVVGRAGMRAHARMTCVAVCV